MENPENLEHQSPSKAEVRGPVPHPAGAKYYAFHRITGVLVRGSEIRGSEKPLAASKPPDFTPPWTSLKAVALLLFWHECLLLNYSSALLNSDL